MKNGKRAYWCDHCLVYVLGVECGHCKRKTRDISSAYLQPVFQSEIEYLKTGFILDGITNLNSNEIWVSPSSNTYYFQGKPVFKLGISTEKNEYELLRGNHIKSSFLSRTKEEYFEIINSANQKYIQHIEYEAKCFIANVLKTYKNRSFFVSYSGGKDSSVVSHLVMQTLGRSNVLHIFADTTIELPETYKFIERYKRKHPLTPFITCKTEMDFFDLSEKIGPPSRILRWCCSTHKTNPLGQIVGVLNPGNGVLAFEGVRKSESTRRSHYERITVDHKIGGEVITRPILEWSDLEIWIYIILKKLEVNYSYEQGFRRVGCLYCPFNSNWSEKLIADYYPEKNKLWIQHLSAHASNINHPNPNSFIGGGWRVRAGGKGGDCYKSNLESVPCELYDDSHNYQIIAGDIHKLKNFLRPFGPQQVIHQDEGFESFVVKSKLSLNILMIVEISYEDQIVRIRYLTESNRLLLRQRTEKQIKKLQCCINCGSCNNACHIGAIRGNDFSSINEKLCSSCLKCVSHDCPAVKSLHYLRNRKSA